jgi:hypothetical protein
MARLRLEKITLLNMIDDPKLSTLADDLVQLPVPESIKIKGKYYPVPQTYEEFCKNLVYGQRLFIARKEDNDYGIIIRVLDGYYYPMVTVNKWDEDQALLFGKYILNLSVIQIYPVAMHLVNLISEVAAREQKLLHRNPSKLELAAGIERLNPFTELLSLDFLRDAMKVTVPEVIQTPYNECLVRFMIAKEQAEFQDRYIELSKEESKLKN